MAKCPRCGSTNVIVTIVNESQLVKDKPGSDEPGFVYFMGLFLLGGIHLESIDS